MIKLLSGRHGVALPLALLLAAGASAQAPPQSGTENLIVYKGESSRESGVTAIAWGSGMVSPDRQVHQDGLQSFKVVTHGMYQGAAFTFEKPFDLGPYLANKNAYFQLTVNMPELFSNQGTPNGPGGSGRYPYGNPGGGGPPGRPPGGFGGPPGGFGGGAPSGRPGGPNPGGFGFGDPQQGGRGGFGGPPPGNFPGGDANGAGKRVAVQRPRSMENLRVVLVTTSGKQLEFLMPVIYTHGADSWRQFSIPVSVISGLKPEDGQIKEMRLFGDQPATFYLSGIRVVNDVTPLAIAPIEDQSALPRNATYRYTAKVIGGATAIKVTWDFDDKDGLQEERVGQVVTYAYRTSGDYVATVTVSDFYGIKAPVTRKFRIHVTL